MPRALSGPPFPRANSLCHCPCSAVLPSMTQRPHLPTPTTVLARLSLPSPRMDDDQIQRFVRDVKDEFAGKDFSNRRGRDETAARVLRSSDGGPFCATPPGDGGGRGEG